jgi:tetratricopeptide (TPR) repeat protein/uncharacterized caspase-like protein
VPSGQPAHRLGAKRRLRWALSLGSSVCRRAGSPVGSVLLLLAFAAPIAVCQEPSAQSPRTWAVVIGISQYQKLPGGQQLQFAENDARSFSNSLATAGGVDLRNIWMLVGPAATQTAVRTALGSWLAKQCSEQDIVYIYFSGHGLVEPEFGESYWLAYDSDPQNIYATGISVDDLKHALSSRIKARRVFIIQDPIRRDFFDPSGQGPAQATAFTRAFSDLAQARPGVLVTIASGPGEFSREGHRWGDAGVFTRFLVDGLSGRADKNKDGVITDEELFDYLAERVPQDTSDKQHPWRSGPDPDPIAMTQPHSRPTAAVPPGRGATQAPPRPPTNIQAGPTQSPGQRGAGTAPSIASGSSAPAAAAPSSVPSPTSSANTADQGTPEAIAPKNQNPPDNQKVGVTTSRPSPPTGSLTSQGAPVSPTPSPSQSTSYAPVEPPPALRNLEKSGASTTGETTPAAIATEAPPPRAESAPPAKAPPPKTLEGPPSVATIPAVSAPARSGDAPGPIAVGNTGPAPSPVRLQFEAALAAGHLVEPKNANAWDLYQQLGSQSESSVDAGRFKDMLASALLRAGQGIAAGDVLQDNVESRSDDFKRAGQMLARLHSLRPDDQSVALLQKLSAAEALISLQFYDEAEHALGQIQTGRTAPIENATGLVYQGQLSQWQAERSFKRAIELDPHWAPPHYNLALLYKSQGKETALAELEQAGKLEPDSVPIMTALGNEYFAASRWADAAIAYKQALAVDPDNDTLHTKLGHCLYSQGLHQEADHEYQRARELAGKNH